MVIQTNVAALMSYRESAKTNRAMKKNLEKLSSGCRINRSSDDASGLAVSERMRIYCTEYGRCHSNAKEGVDLAKTADGALAEVNDMLRRARELCIQAENGTYSEQELASISDEINELFSEVDRITEGSFFNKIQLFRGEVEPDYHFEYQDTFTPLPVGDLEKFGEMDFVQGKTFEEAKDATPATATFELSDDIDLNDPQSLNGTVLNIGSSRYCFGSRPSDSSYGAVISLGSTVEQTLKNLETYTNYKVSLSGRTVTLTAPLRDWTYYLYGEKEVADKGDGDWANGIAVQSPASTGSLGTVKVTSAQEYSTPIKMEYSFGKTGTISQDDLEDLKCNTLSLREYRNGSWVNTPLSLKLESSVTGTTWEQFGNNLASKINVLAKYDASYADGKLSITYTPTDTAVPSSMQIYITNSIKVKPVDPTVIDPGAQAQKMGTLEKSTSLGGFKVTQTQAPGAEAREVCTVEIPSVSGFPCSFSINGSKYLYYDSTKSEYSAALAALRTANPKDTFTLQTDANRPISVTSVTSAQIASDISSRVLSALGGSNAVTVNVIGNKLEIIAKNRGTNLKNTLDNMFKPATCEIYTYREYRAPETTGGSDAVYSKYVIPDQSSPAQTVNQTTTVELGADVKGLEGKGFYIGGHYIEFINSASDGGGSKRNDYVDIELKDCSDHNAVKDAVAGQIGSSYTVALDGTNLKITRSSTFSAGSSAISGIKQLSKSGEVKFAGGVDTGYSQTLIDFSSINSDNMNDLLGKGFRINCATCTGEYINVFFCGENDGSMPASFEREDPQTGTIRTIHNIAVELSKVTSGDQIVQSIVEQVKPQLHHYTDVDVGNPPTTLIAREKRHGDVTFDGTLYLGSVATGVETNFTYSGDVRKVEDHPDDGSVAIKENVVEIYVGSEPDPQIIPIHLPYIDLKTLRLRPPETVDLNADDQDASDWLNRVDQANLAISKARGVIGADHNRLESAVQALSNVKENITDAESRIRDTDMAEEMMEHVKLQILTQSQQSMLSQAMAQPQQVLRLIS